jgi:hypothetical protein
MWEDPFDTVYRSRAAADVLLSAPLATPTPEQVRIVKEALRVAVRAGLRHLPSPVRFKWHAAGDAAERRFGLNRFDEAPQAWSANGVVTVSAEGEVSVHLNASISNKTLAHTVLHELQHVDDRCSGMHQDLTRPESEHRAERFADQAFAEWDGPTTW